MTEFSSSPDRTISNRSRWRKTWLQVTLTALICLVAPVQVSAKGHAQMITFSVKNAPLLKVFNEYLKQQPYPYNILDNNIIVKTKASRSLPHPINVTGKAMNEKGEPVTEVTVAFKGTGKGTSTNNNGELSLTGVERNTILYMECRNIKNINPNGVKIITILKDADATSMYGSREGNGVIVITTKRGQTNQQRPVKQDANERITDQPTISNITKTKQSGDLSSEEYLLQTDNKRFIY